MKIDYHEISLQDVLNYFVEGFTFEPGHSLYRHEAFIDTAQQKVIFKLVIHEPKKYDLNKQEDAIAFLQRAGIVDDSGQLKEMYQE